MFKPGDKVKFKLRQTSVHFGTDADGNRFAYEKSHGWQEAGIGILVSESANGYWRLRRENSEKEFEIFGDQMMKI